MFYDKFRDSKNVQVISTEAETHKTENSSEYSRRYSDETKSNEIKAVECLLNNFYGTESTKINLSKFFGFGTEAPDDPFDGIAPEDAALDDPENGSQSEGNDNQNDLNDPFGNLTDEQENLFGGDGTNEESDNKVTKELEVDRNELLQASHDLSASVRQLFPKRFIELLDTIGTNIKIVEKLALYVDENDELIQSIMGAYNDQAKLINDFLNVITEKTFDQIFEMYVKIHTNCMQIKESYDLIVNEIIPDETKKNKR